MNIMGAFAVFAILYRRDNHGKLRLLLIRDRDMPNRWKLAGGKWEQGETVRQALIRELHQELDISINAQSIEKAIYVMRLSAHTFIVFSVPYSKRFGPVHTNETELVRSKWFPMEEVKMLLRRGQILPHHTSALNDFIADQES
jgi:8-oxo-dGTP pyrophosphatase MutT (NUDIX family)